MTRPGASCSSAANWATSTSSGTSPTRATSGAERTIVRRRGGDARRARGRAPGPGARAGPWATGGRRQKTPSIPSRLGRGGRRRGPRPGRRGNVGSDRPRPSRATRGHARPPAAVPGGQRRADGPGPLAERRAGTISTSGRPAPPSTRSAKARRVGVEERARRPRPGRRRARCGGVEDGGQVGQPEGHPPAQLVEHGQGPGVAAARPPVTCSPRTVSGSPPARRHDLRRAGRRRRPRGPAARGRRPRRSAPSSPAARTGTADRRGRRPCGRSRRRTPMAPTHDPSADDQPAADAGARG